MPLHDGFAQHQAEPGAGFSPQAGPPGFGKGLKQHGLQSQGNADAIVMNVNEHTAGARFDDHADVAVIGRELQCIAHQVEQHLGELVDVQVSIERRGGQRVGKVVGNGTALELVQRLAQHLAHFHPVPLQVAVGRGQEFDVDEVANHFHAVAAGGFQLAQHHGHLGVGRGAHFFPQKLRDLLHHDKGPAQVVRQDFEGGVLAAVEQVGIGLVAFGHADVAQAAYQPDGPMGIPLIIGRQAKPLVRGVGVAQAKLNLVAHQAPTPPRPVFGQAGLVVGMQPGQQRGQFGVHLVRHPAQYRPVGLVHERYFPGRQLIHELDMGAGFRLADE